MGLIRTNALVVVTAAMLGIASACQSSANSDFRTAVTREGPTKLLATFRKYPEPDAPTVKTRNDFDFFHEVAVGDGVNPRWIASSPDYGRVRSLAIYFLAVDHQNRHFVLSPTDLRMIREYARSKLADKNSEPDTRREALRSLGATAEPADIATIESIASSSNDTQIIQEAAVSLALICDGSAGLAMERVLDSKQTLLSPQFRHLAVETRAAKQRGLCAK